MKCGERYLVHTFGGYVARQLYDGSWAFDGSVVLAGDVGWEQRDGLVELGDVSYVRPQGSGHPLGRRK